MTDETDKAGTMFSEGSTPGEHRAADEKTTAAVSALLTALHDRSHAGLRSDLDGDVHNTDERSGIVRIAAETIASLEYTLLAARKAANRHDVENGDIEPVLAWEAVETFEEVIRQQIDEAILRLQSDLKESADRVAAAAPATD